MRICSAALLVLGLSLAHAKPQQGPQNVVVVEQKKANETETDTVKMKKGDLDNIFNSFQSDDAMATTCIMGQFCKQMSIRDAKGLARAEIMSVSALKGDTELSNTLSPSIAAMSASLRKLQEQNEQLKKLELAMESLAAASSKGQTLNEQVKGQFAETMSKAAVFSAPADNYKGLFQAPSLPGKGADYLAPPSKGTYLAPPSKGANYLAPPSKGASAGVQYEAVMCPMTVYELGKCQKYSNELKVQVESANVVNARLMADKSRLEAELAAMKMLKEAAEQQAAFNAKYAAEKKSEAEMLSKALGVCNAEKDVVKAQKSELEVQLSTTQKLLTVEKAKNAELSTDLAACNAEKDDLSARLAVQTQRAEDAEEELAETRARLEEETEARINCEETLAFTENRLAQTEADLNKERELREKTEEELMATMVSLSSCQKESRVLNEMLANTREELQQTIAALAREEEARRTVQAKLDETTEELRATQQELRDTRRALEDEQNAHATTQRILEETEEQLAACEAARVELEEAKQKLEDELAETKTSLDIMTAERDQLQTTLDATSAALAEATAQKMQCESNLAAQTAVSEELRKQLVDAMAMLKMEKEAREGLAATIVLVQETAMKVQEEVKKLQEENALLLQQVEKLKSEQEVALAMAAGCPPTYEKFGSSCYKYVREKTPWKSAQEQCMKDRGNLVAIESTQEQIFLTNYLKRHGATDAYSFTGGLKYQNYWKWLGQHSPLGPPEFWYNLATKTKAGYDCQAMYIHSSQNYGQWVGLPCYTAAPYVCEYQLLPVPATVQSGAEQMAILQMAEDAPPYLKAAVRY